MRKNHPLSHRLSHQKAEMRDDSILRSSSCLKGISTEVNADFVASQSMLEVEHGDVARVLGR